MSEAWQLGHSLGKAQCGNKWGMVTIKHLQAAQTSVPKGEDQIEFWKGYASAMNTCSKKNGWFS